MNAFSDRMMQRKRDGYEVNPMEKYLSTKKPKINDGLLSTESSTSTFLQNNPLDISNSSQISVQSTTMVFPNRKRRSRNAQQMYESDSSTFNSADGQIRKRADLSCVVCCAVAHGYNFDAISCESCKAFFRRNALFTLDRLKCRRDGNCEITVETRRRCKSCRLKKCFTVGMRKEWILTEEEKVNKKRRIEENRKLRDNTPNESISPKTSPTKSDLDLKITHRQTRKSTSSDDLITNLVMIYNDHVTIDLTGYGWSYPLARKITGLCPLINTRSNTALRLISFFKRLYDFDILNEVDKITLLKSNLPYVFFLHGSLNYDPTHDVYHQENTADKPLYGVDIREVYGIDRYTRLTKIMQSLSSIIQIDKRIVQVALVILLFSKGLSVTVHSHQPVGNNQQEIFRTQNKYVEQLWIYIEKIYGQIRAINIFSTLISKCLIMQELTRDIQHDLYEIVDPSQVPNLFQTLVQPI